MNSRGLLLDLGRPTNKTNNTSKVLVPCLKMKALMYIVTRICLQVVQVVVMQVVAMCIGLYLGQGANINMDANITYVEGEGGSLCFTTLPLFLFMFCLCQSIYMFHEFRLPESMHICFYKKTYDGLHEFR